ncbi:MAG: hypothetical protein AAF513_12435 [Pseudomonadota bacterium]
MTELFRFETTFAALHEGAADFDPQLTEFFALDETLRYQVRLPADAQQAPGLLVYVSPKSGAALPDAWAPALDRHNLIWVGAENSGNDVHVARRVGMALLAPAVARHYRDPDTARHLLSGFSGGGRVASMMLPAYPEIYSGALFICGANPVAILTDVTQQRLRDVPMVFLTGTGDFNLQDTQWSIASFQQAGLAAQLVVIEGLGHALPEEIDGVLDTLAPGPGNPV